MSEKPCPLHVSPEEYAALRNCEAVVVREHETVDGARRAVVVAWGELEEMKIQADTPSLFIVPVGFHIIGQRALLVKDLIGPKYPA